MAERGCRMMWCSVCKSTTTHRRSTNCAAWWKRQSSSSAWERAGSRVGRQSCLQPPFRRLLHPDITPLASQEGVLHGDTEILLARVQVLRPDPSTPASFSRCHDHTVIEMHTIFGASLHCSPHDVAVRDNYANTSQRIQHCSHILWTGSRRHLMKQSRRNRR